jgi:hypothetical protein
MGRNAYTDSEVLDQFRNILLTYGESLTSSQYLELKDVAKPSLSTVITKLGSWTEAKSLALGTPQDKMYDHLVAQNDKLLKRLVVERDKSQVFVESCLASIEKMDIKPVKIPKYESVKEELIFKSLRSDAHVGEITDEKHVQMLARYSTDIYKTRLNTWLEKVLKFREQDKNSLGLNTLSIYHLGDQVGGENIYKGQQFYLDLPLVDQLFTSVECETSAILALAEYFPKIEVFCVPGNHGRPGLVGTNHPRTNFDYIFYRSMKTALSGQKNVSVYVSESPYMLIQEGNYKVLMNHGDNVRSWQGIPFYGLERHYSRLHSLYGTIVDVELVAHHHQPLNICDRILMNGAFPGGSDMSINRMSITNIPSQKIFYFHPEHGINRESNLYLDNGVSLDYDDNNIYTSYV